MFNFEIHVGSIPDSQFTEIIIVVGSVNWNIA